MDVSRRLNGVGVEQDALFLTDRADLCDGQDGADLVVGIHDRHEAGVVADGVAHLLGGDRSGLADRQKLHLEALLFEPLQRMENGMVLKRGGDDVLFPLARAELRRRKQRLIVRLASAGGECDLPRLTAETRGNAFPCALERLRGLLADGVQA